MKVKIAAKKGCLDSVEWNGGMEWWTGMVECNSGMVESNGGMEQFLGNFN